MSFVEITNSSDEIRTIAISHGEKNLLNPAVMTDLREALLSADRDESVKGIILTGNGAFFCGGLDVAAIQAGGDPVDFAQHLISVLKVFPTLSKPISAAVNGDAVASGASLVAAVDFAVALPSARVGTYEVSVGIWPMIAQVPLIQRIGARAAMENVGSGEPFSAQRALEVGLIQKIVDKAELLPSAHAWVLNGLRGKGAIAAGRKAFYELAEMPYDKALDKSFEIFVSMFK
jgi:enoyl-CoA hydratase/carnithine racemase